MAWNRMSKNKTSKKKGKSKPGKAEEGWDNEIAAEGKRQYSRNQGMPIGNVTGMYLWEITMEHNVS